ncbi:MAG: hypothetical protein RSB67_00335 [Clostridia bacterium]
MSKIKLICIVKGNKQDTNKAGSKYSVCFIFIPNIEVSPIIFPSTKRQKYGIKAKNAYGSFLFLAILYKAIDFKSQRITVDVKNRINENIIKLVICVKLILDKSVVLVSSAILLKRTLIISVIFKFEIFIFL